mmetsp:Transcript_13989/g.29513  ORF Transcript_13989/g.29513 Transcript_13989/m.29513 type:complete len:205 (-) Transcript_13989:2221-2835(-)
MQIVWRIGGNCIYAHFHYERGGRCLAFMEVNKSSVGSFIHYPRQTDTPVLFHPTRCDCHDDRERCPSSKEVDSDSGASLSWSYSLRCCFKLYWTLCGYFWMAVLVLVVAEDAERNVLTVLLLLLGSFVLDNGSVVFLVVARRSPAILSRRGRTKRRPNPFIRSEMVFAVSSEASLSFEVLSLSFLSLRGGVGFGNSVGDIGSLS